MESPDSAATRSASAANEAGNRCDALVFTRSRTRLMASARTRDRSTAALPAVPLASTVSSRPAVVAAR